MTDNSETDANDYYHEPHRMNAAEATARLTDYCVCGQSAEVCKARAILAKHVTDQAKRRCAGCGQISPCISANDAANVLAVNNVLPSARELGCKHFADGKLQRRTAPFWQRFFGASF